MRPFLDRLGDAQPIVFDGGIGSELFARGVELTNTSLANESHPEAVVDIHSAYIEAGSDAIETNTFVGSSLHLEMAGKDGEDAAHLAALAVSHARSAVALSGREVYVAGSVGPSPGAIEADAGDVEFGIPNEKVREAHARVIGVLAEGGVDFLSIETMFSAKEAAIAADEARKTGIPIAVNLTCKYTRDRKTGDVVYRTDWGDTPRSLLDVLASGEFSQGDNLLDHIQILGMNCGAEPERVEHTGMPYAINGLRQIRSAMEEAGIEGKRLMAFPNAGVPHMDRETRRTTYTQSPEEMAGLLPELLKAGAHIVGGCCGTGPDHIRAFREVVDSRSDVA